MDNLNVAIIGQYRIYVPMYVTLRGNIVQL